MYIVLVVMATELSLIGLGGDTSVEDDALGIEELGVDGVDDAAGEREDAELKSLPLSEAVT